MKNTLKIFGSNRTRALRCYWLLEEMGVPYESIPVDLAKRENQSTKFIELNPYGKVPVMLDGDFMLAESGAILTYLSEKHSTGKLIPHPGTWERGKYNQWMFFAMSEMDAYLWTINRHASLYPEEKRSPQAIEMAKGEFSKSLEAVHQTLAQHQFILGAEFTTADILVGAVLAWAKALKIDLEYARLDEYVANLKNRPAFKKALGKS
ncbi:MAG: glutathione S-transferase family protein [Pseudomonadota bacterium]|nr:glutathione S-transferase family protein [Pseudomonadota bacterium]